MKILVWSARFAVFLLLFWFAVKNTDRVVVTLPGGVVWPDIPLILVMLACFAAGTLFGLLIGLPTTFRQHRELGRLRRNAQQAAASTGAADSDASSRRP